jgi:hypothetical protein
MGKVEKLKHKNPEILKSGKQRNFSYFVAAEVTRLILR